MKTPQELIDMPGYGKTQAELVKKKQWNEGLALDGVTMKEITVTVRDPIFQKLRLKLLRLLRAVLMKP